MMFDVSNILVLTPIIFSEEVDHGKGSLIIFFQNWLDVRMKLVNPPAYEFFFSKSVITVNIR